MIKRFFLERKLLKIWLLETKVQEANSFKELALIRIDMFNAFWDRENPHGTLKGKIMSFKFSKIRSQQATLEDKKLHLLLILAEFKKSYEQKLLKLG
jgi:hypothetical protein